MPTVKFDMSDPETKAVVDGWADNTEYTIRTGEGATRFIAEVLDEEMDEENVAEDVEEAGPPGPRAIKNAMSEEY